MTSPIRRRIAAALLSGTTLGMTLGMMPGAAQAAESRGFSGGVEFNDKVVAADIGLPAYPGAQPQRDSPDDATGLSFGLWGGSFGFKLVVAKYASTDGVDAVAEFYRKALAATGPVLDCSRGAARPAMPSGPSAPSRAADGKRQLVCDDEPPTAKARVYKAGTPQRFRLVSIEPTARGTRFQLVLVESSAP